MAINYLKNVLKSVAFSAADIVGDIMPNAKDFIRSSADIGKSISSSVQQTYSAIKLPPSTSRKRMAAFQNSKVYGALQYTWGNIIEDLTSGNFYNRERQERDEDKFSGFDFGFNDSDFGFDDNFDTDFNEPNDSSDSLKIISSVEGSTAASTQTLVRTLLTTTDTSMKNYRVSTSMMFEQNERLFGNLQKTTSTIGSTLQAIHNIQKSVLPNLDSNISSFQTEALKNIQQINQNIAQLKAWQEEDRKLADEKQAANISKKKGALRFSDISYGGTIYADDYLGNIKKKFLDEISPFTMFTDMMFGGFSGGENKTWDEKIADAISSNLGMAPLRFITNAIARSFIPKNMTTAMKDMNEMFGGLFANTIGKLNETARSSNYFSLQGFLSRIFGIDTGVKRAINTGAYEKGRVPWDGLSRRALINVIPGYLRRIEAYLSGRGETDYDYDSGKWVKLSDTAKEFADIKTYAARNASNELLKEMTPALHNNKPTDTSIEVQTSYRRAIDEFIQYLYDRDGQFYPNESRHTNDINEKLYPNLFKHFDAIAKSYREFDEVKRLDADGNPIGIRHSKNGLRLRTVADIISGKDTEARRYEYLSRDGTSSMTKLQEYTKKVSMVGESNGGAIGSILTLKDRYGQTIHSYLHNINQELMFWRLNFGRSGFGETGTVRSPIRSSGPRFSFESLGESLMTEEQKIADQKQREKEEEERANANIDSVKSIKRSIFNKILGNEYDDLQKIYSDEELRLLLNFSKMHPDELKKEFDKLDITREYDEKVVKDFFKKQFIDTELDDMDKIRESIEEAKIQGKKTYEVSKKDNLLEKIWKKFTGFFGMDNASKIFEKSAERITEGIYAVDEYVYDMFFKRHIKEDGTPYNGFFDFLIGETGRGFKNLFDNLNKNIIDPLKKKLGIEDGFMDRFKNQFKNVAKTVASGVYRFNREVVFDPTMDWLVSNNITGNVMDYIMPGSAHAAINRMNLKDYQSKVSSTRKKRYQDRILASMYGDPLARRFNGQSIDDKINELATTFKLNPDELRERIKGETVNGSFVEYKEEKQHEILNDLFAKLNKSNAEAERNRRIKYRVEETDFDGTIEEKVDRLKQIVDRDNPDQTAEFIKHINRLLEYSKSDEEKHAALNKLYSRIDLRRHAKGTPDGTPFIGDTMLSEGELLVNEDGVSMVNKTAPYSIKKPTQILNTEQSYDLLDSLNLPTPKARKSIQQAESEEKAIEKKVFKGIRSYDNQSIPHHAEGTTEKTEAKNNNRRYFFTKDELRQAFNEIRQNSPEIAAGGVIGAIASTALGITGGPLIGAAVGAASTLVSRSEALQDALFGKIGKDGERDDSGIISKSIQNIYKKYSPDMIKFGTVGATASLLLPFGPVTGMFLGAGLGFLKHNDALREKLFGVLDVKEDEKNILKRFIPAGIKGAAAGSLISLLVGGPFGLAGNAVLGAAMGMVSSTDEFKETLFGTYVNGVNVRKGIVNILEDAFEPIRQAGEEFKDRIFNALNDNIIQPLKDFISPAIHAIPQIAAWLPKKINDMLYQHFGLSLEHMVKKLIMKPLEFLMKPVSKIGGWLFRMATSPFRLVGAAGNWIRRRQMQTMNADYMTAEERMAFDERFGREASESDKFFASIGSEGFTVDQAKEMRDTLLSTIDNRKQAQVARVKAQNSINDILDNYKTADGKHISGAQRSMIRKIMQRTETLMEKHAHDNPEAIKVFLDQQQQRIVNILQNNALENSDVGMTAEQVKALMNGESGLATALTNYGDAQTRYTRVKFLDEDTREAAQAKSAQLLEQAGLSDKIDLTNIDDIRKFIKYLNTEIKDREANQIGIGGDENKGWAAALVNPEDVHSVSQSLADILKEGIKIRIDGNDFTNLVQDLRLDLMNKALGRIDDNETRIQQDRMSQLYSRRASATYLVNNDDKVRAQAQERLKSLGIDTDLSNPDEVKKYASLLSDEIDTREFDHTEMDDSGTERAVYRYRTRGTADYLTERDREELKAGSGERFILTQPLFGEFKRTAAQKRADRVYNIQSKSGIRLKYANDDVKDYIVRELSDENFNRINKVLHKRWIVEFITRKRIELTKKDIDKLIDLSKAEVKALNMRCKFIVQNNLVSKFDTIYEVLNARTTDLQAMISQYAVESITDEDDGDLEDVTEPQQGDTSSAVESPIEHHFLGTLLSGGKSLLGSLFGSGDKEEQQPVQQQVPNTNAILASGVLQQVQQPQVQSGNFEETDKEGDNRDVVQTSEGPAFVKRKPDGSVEYDTTENKTAAIVNKITAKEKFTEKLQAAQLKAAEALSGAFSIGTKVGKAAKKGMGWLPALLLGGMLWKSGALQGIWDNALKPFWNDTVAPFLTNTAAPWFMETVIPGIASAAGSALKFVATDIIVPVIESAVTNFGKIITGAWNGYTGVLNKIWNKIMPDSDNTNAGVVATVDTKTDVHGNERDMTQPSGVKSRDGREYTWQELEDLKSKYKPGDILDAYNAEGAQMYIDEADGEIKAQDQSSEWEKPVKVLSRAAWQAFVDPSKGYGAAKVVDKIAAASGKVLGKVPIVGKLAEMTTKGAAKPISAALKFASATGEILQNPAAYLARRTAEKAGVNAGWLSKIAGWCQKTIDAIFGNEEVVNAFNKISEFFNWPGKKAQQIFDSIKEGFHKLFNKSMDEGAKNAGEQMVTEVNTKMATSWLNVVTQIYYFTSGWDQAEAILGVVDPGYVEKFVAATVKWIGNWLIIPAIFPGVPEIARFLVRTFYKIIGKDEEYDARVKEADEMFAAYLHDTAPGSTLTKEEWLEKEYSVTGAVYHATVKGISDMGTAIGDWMFDRSTDQSTLRSEDLEWIATKDLNDKQFLEEYAETLSSPRSLYNGMLMRNPAFAEVYIRGCLVAGIDLITGKKLTGPDYATIRTVYKQSIAPFISKDEEEAEYLADLFNQDKVKLGRQNKIFTDLATGKRRITEHGDLNAEFTGANTSIPTQFDYSSGTDEEFARENYMEKFNSDNKGEKYAALENYKNLWLTAFNTTGGFSDDIKAKNIENLYRAMSITKLHPITRKPITEGDMAFVKFMYDVYANNLFDDVNYQKILDYMNSFGGNLVYARRVLENSAQNKSLTKASTLMQTIAPSEAIEPQTGQGKFGRGEDIFPPYQVTATMKNISEYLTKQMVKMFGEFTDAAKPKIIEVEKPVAIPTTPSLPELPSNVFKQSNDAGDILDSLDDIEGDITNISDLISTSQKSVLDTFTGALSDIFKTSKEGEQSFLEAFNEYAEMPSYMRDRMLYGYNEDSETELDEDAGEGKYGRGNETPQRESAVKVAEVVEPEPIDYTSYFVEGNETLKKIYDTIYEYIHPETTVGTTIKNAKPEMAALPATISNNPAIPETTTNEETKDKVLNTPINQPIANTIAATTTTQLASTTAPVVANPVTLPAPTTTPVQPTPQPAQPQITTQPVMPQNQTPSDMLRTTGAQLGSDTLSRVTNGRVNIPVQDLYQDPRQAFRNTGLDLGSKLVSRITNNKINIPTEDLIRDPRQALRNTGAQLGSDMISRMTRGKVNISTKDLATDPRQALRNTGLQLGSDMISRATNGKVNMTAQDLATRNYREPLRNAALNELNRRLGTLTTTPQMPEARTPGFLGMGKYGRGEPVEESGYINSAQDWGNTVVRWGFDAAGNPIVGNLKTNVVKGLASTTKNIPVVGKVTNAAANVVTAPFQIGSKAGEIARRADGTSSYMDLIKWFLNKVMTAMEKFFNLPIIQNSLVKLATTLGQTRPMEFVKNFVSKIINFVKSAVPKAAEKLGITEFLSTAARYSPIIGNALAVYDLVVGMDEAEYLLGIKNVTWVDQFIAGFVKAFSNYIVIPTLWPGLNEFTRFIYRYLLGNKVANRYEEEVQKTDDEYKAYVANTSKPLSKADWLSQEFSVSGKVTSALGNLVFHPIDTISSWFMSDNKEIVEEKSHPITYQGIAFSTEELRQPPRLPEGTVVIGSDGQAHLSPDLLKNPNEAVLRSYGITPPNSGQGKYGRGIYSKQIDPSIANIRYNSKNDSEYQTIGDSGCGPVAAVNAIESAFGRGNRTLEAVNYALDGGYKETNGGTKPKFFTDYFADNGLSSSTTSSKSTMIDKINSGYPTVLMGQDKGGVSPDTPYGATQHYVTVTGTDGRGHAIVQDPESRYDNLLYDTDKLVSKSSLAVSAEGKFGRGKNIQRGLEIRNYLMSKGIPEKAAYGMIGNIEQESHLDPTIVEYLLRDEYRKKDPNAYGINWKGKNYQREYTAAIDSGKLPLSEFLYPHVSQDPNRKDYGKQARRGYGLVQFTSAGLKQDLYNNTVKKGISIGSLTGQLDAVLNMLKSSYKKLYATLTNPNIQTGDAAEAFVRQYERPAQVNQRAVERRRYAAEWEQALTGSKGGMPAADQPGAVPNAVANADTSTVESTVPGTENTAPGADTGGTTTFKNVTTEASDPSARLMSAMSSGSIGDRVNGMISAITDYIQSMLPNSPMMQLPGTDYSSTTSTSPSTTGDTTTAPSGDTGTTGAAAPAGGGETTAGQDVGTASNGQVGDAIKLVQVAQREAALTDGSNKENPKGSNAVKYNDWFYGKHVSGKEYPWCAAFVSWLGNQAGLGRDVIPKDASTKSMYAKIGQHGGSYPKLSEARPGDLFFYSKNGSPSTIYHTGVVESATNGAFSTVQGNNNDAVIRKSYRHNANILLARPPYKVPTDFNAVKQRAVENPASTIESHKGTRGGNASKPFPALGQWGMGNAKTPSVNHLESTKVRTRDGDIVEESGEDKKIGIGMTQMGATATVGMGKLKSVLPRDNSDIIRNIRSNLSKSVDNVKEDTTPEIKPLFGRGNVTGTTENTLNANTTQELNTQASNIANSRTDVNPTPQSTGGFSDQATKDIVSSLIQIAKNTDNLNVIVTILNKKLGTDITPNDIAEAQSNTTSISQNMASKPTFAAKNKPVVNGRPPQYGTGAARQPDNSLGDSSKLDAYANALSGDNLSSITKAMTTLATE